MIAAKDIYWLAGLLEGEGCFGLHRGKTPLIRLAMTDEDVVRRAAAILKPPSVRTRPGRHDGYKPVWLFQLQSAKAAGWMMTLFQFMGARRKQKIEEILTTWRAVPPANRYKQTCPKGHPYSKQNIRGERVCRVCDAALHRAQRAQQRQTSDGHTGAFHAPG